MPREAVAAARTPPGQVATLVLPADVSWSEGARPAAPTPVPDPSPVHGRRRSTLVAKALRSGEPAALLLGGRAVREAGLVAASRIANVCDAKLLAETFPTRLERGAGRPAVDRLGYLAEFTVAQLSGLRHLVIVDAKAPVSFFAYPDKPSYLVPDDCAVHVLAAPGDDALGALGGSSSTRSAPARTAPTPQPALRPERPTGPVSGESVAASLGAVLPEGAIVVDESQTLGIWASGATAGAPRHDWLTLTGGSIGFGLPAATGAAVACPDRPVVCLEADGSAMYTLQALWTQAREGLDVTTIILNNRSYAILNMELQRVGADRAGSEGTLDARPLCPADRLRRPLTGPRRPRGATRLRRGVHRRARARPSRSPAPTSSKPSSDPRATRGPGVGARRGARRCGRRGRRAARVDARRAVRHRTPPR